MQGDALSLLDILLLYKPGVPGPPGINGVAGVQGIPGPVDGPTLVALQINEDLSAQVNGVKTVFDVLVSAVATPFIDAGSLVFCAGLECTAQATLNGAGAQFTLLGPGGVALTTDDLGGGSLRFYGVKA